MMKKCKCFNRAVLWVILLSLVLSSSASALTYRQWDGGGADNLWNNPVNWEYDAVPGSAYAANIDNPVVGQPYVSWVVNATNTQIAVGVSNGPCVLTMTSGTLTSTGSFVVGQHIGGDGTVDMSGGVINIAKTLYVSVDGTGVLNISGGTINTLSIRMGYPSVSTSSGVINLNGGTINVEQNIEWFNPDNIINIAGGSLVLNGDRREEFARYADKGWVTGYGETDPRRIKMSYNQSTKKTTITADDPLDYDMAWNPGPDNYAGAGDVEPDAVLSWSAGTGADSHDVYLGADFDDVDNASTADDEYEGNYAVNSFDPCGLQPGRTYYWRVDEVDGATTHKGEVWQFTVKLHAFAGAQGSGAWTIGGRGGEIYEVTNLNDSGPGSFREALEARGRRVVVFRVSGTIPLESDITISYPYLTIAGQTAPGDGICLKNYGLFVDADHVIIRYLRIRPGDTLASGQTSKDVRSIVMYKRNAMIDHCSTSWCTDQTLDVWNQGPQGGNVTVQWCLITESLDDSVHSKGIPHGCGSLLRGGWGTEISYHHNLYAHHHIRVPDIGNKSQNTFDDEGWTVDFRNNIIYNWGENRAGRNFCGHDGEYSITKVNFVENYYKAGLDTPYGYYAYLETTKPSKGYFYNNLMDGGYPSDPWSLVVFWHDVAWTSAEIAAYKQSSPFESGPVGTDSASVAYDRILAEAGATLPRQDSVDTRVINEVINGTGGIIDSQDDVGGWPTLNSTSPPDDSDHDGMPDDWEVQHGLDPYSSADGSQDSDSDGYTNLEEYLEYLISGGKAFNPRPANQATDVYLDNILSWESDPCVVSHNVYFGNTNPPAFQSNQTETGFEVGPLSQNTAYYWRIDDIYSDKTVAGDVWSFISIAADEKLESLSDDFEDGDYDNNPTWIVATDYWEVVQEAGGNDYLRMRDSDSTPGNEDFGTIHTSFAAITDGKFEVTMKVQAEDDSNRLRNYIDIFMADGYGGDSYYVSINQLVGTPSALGVAIKKYDGGAYITLTTTDDYDCYGDWTDLKFTYDSSLSSDNIKLYLDNMTTPYLTATDNSHSTFSDISLRTRRDDHLWGFDDIKLYSYEVLVSAEYTDIDDSNMVNLGDFAILAKYWLWDCTNPHEVEKADINRSGEVNTEDLSMIADYWLSDF